MEKRVLTVLRSGGEYGPEHVQAMQRQVRKWAPEGTRFTCLSDVAVPGVEIMPLAHKWPGWWSKLELFDPEVPDDFLYTDLDNVILGPIGELLETGEFTADIGFSLFRMTPDVAVGDVYNDFRGNSEGHMVEWDPTIRRDGKFGDAAFLRWRCGLTPAVWPEPQVMNIVDMPFAGGQLTCPWRVSPRTVPETVRVMLCGGKRRRPWLSISQEIQRAYWCREK